MVEKAVHPRPASPAKRAAVLRAARRCFARHGLVKTTMDDIARDAAMAKATLYYYYPAKEDLFRAVVEQEQAEFTAAIAGVMTGDRPAAEKLRLYVDHRYRYFRKVANLSMLNYQALLEMRPVFSTLFSSFAERELLLIRRILLEGRAAGAFALPDPDPIARLFLHALHGLRLRHFRKATHADPAVRDASYAELRKEMRLLAGVFVDALAHPARHAVRRPDSARPPRSPSRKPRR